MEAKFINLSPIYPIFDFDYALKHGLCFKNIISMWSKSHLIDFIQIRAKSLSFKSFACLYKEIQTFFPNLKIVLNDHWDLAIELNAFGFHIGKKDFESLTSENKKRIQNSLLFKGTSCHSLEDLYNLEDFWSYTGLGPIFSTENKKNYKHTVGIKQLELIPIHFKIPIFLIGGINEINLKSILKINHFKIASISCLSYKEKLTKISKLYESRN